MSGSIEKPCPYCGSIAKYSPSKGLWCAKCKNGTKIGFKYRSKTAYILIIEILILFFLGFFERFIQLVDKNYRIEIEGVD